MQHWLIHKKVCKKLQPPEIRISVNSNLPLPSTSRETNSTYGDWCPNNMTSDKTDEINEMMASLPVVYNPNYCVANPQKILDFNIPSDEEIFSSLSSELLSSDNNFWDLINSCDTQNISDFAYLDRDTAKPELNPNFSPYTKINENNSAITEDVHMECASLNDICANVVHDLDTFGICVLDKFIGANYGNLILQEVKNLYLTGVFQKGELVNPNPYETKESVRCDVTTWVDGTEPNCKHIGNLIKKLDVVVTTCNKMPNNGQLSKCKLHRRTKAMIACYPGDGTYYKKHIDNPHKDGRCITCIYYLNQDWDIKTHGGLLRMFPSAHDSQVANIEPIFDRMLFFWSDKRNPHEVLPSFATRFAITVWYFDADERDCAIAMSRERVLMKTRNQSFRN